MCTEAKRRRGSVGLAGVGFYSVAWMLATVAWGCTSDDTPGVTVVVVEAPGDDVRFGGGVVVVIDDGTYVVTGKPGADCVHIGTQCVDLAGHGDQYCGDPGAQADVVIVDGEVVDVICYPPYDEGTPIEEVVVGGDGEVEVPQTSNGTVIVFDSATNGVPIEDNVTLEAERTTLWGNGADATIIDGNLTVVSNNSRVRSLTVTGNVRYMINANESALSFCRVHGNLEVEANGFSGLECEVYGNVVVRGNNAILVNIGVGGNWEVSGGNPRCEGCYSIDDANANFRVDEDEIGGPLFCD